MPQQLDPNKQRIIAKGKSICQKLDQLLSDVDSEESSSNITAKFSAAAKLIEELCSLIGPQTPSFSIRAELTRDFCNIVKKHKLDVNTVSSTCAQRLWQSFRDMLDSTKQQEMKLTGLQLIYAILSEGPTLIQERLSMLIDIFNVVRSIDDVDAAYKVKIFRLVTNNGANVGTFSPKILIEAMIGMIKKSSKPEGHQECLRFIGELMQQQFSLLDSESLILIIEIAAKIMLQTKISELAVTGLSIFEMVIKHGSVPPQGIVAYCSTLCYTINFKVLSDKSVDIMNALLRSKLGQRAFQILVDILSYSQNVNLHRGAVFFVGMATWGKNRVTEIESNFGVVLQGMLKVLSNNSEIVAYEVLLNIKRLVTKYGEQLSMEWDSVFGILTKIHIYYQMRKNNALQIIISDTLAVIEDLHHKDKFQGDIPELIRVLEQFKEIISESSISFLLEYLQKQIHPCFKDWLSDLKHLMDVYFVNETRSSVKKKALEIIRHVLFKTAMLYEDDAIEVVLPSLKQTFLYHDVETCLLAADVLISVAKELKLSEKNFSVVIRILNKISINASNGDIRLAAASGMIDIFLLKFTKLPCSEASCVYGCLVKLMDHTDVVVRQKVLSCLGTLSANRNYQLSLDAIRSPYLRSHSKNMIRTISFVLPISNFVDEIIDRVPVEPDMTVFLGMLKALQQMLLNSYVVADILISRVCGVICSTAKTRRDTIFSKKYIGEKAEDLSISNLYIDILRLLLGYRDQYTSQQRKQLVDTLLTITEAIMAEQPPNQTLLLNCLDTLSISIAEVTNDVFCFDKDILSLILKLKEMNCSTEIIVASLDVLHNMALNCPDTSTRGSLLTEVFQFALVYTDSSKYEYYVLIMSHRVMTSWFTKCSFGLRQQLVRISIPVLYHHMSTHGCTIAETTIDFLVKYAYLSCDQSYEMNEQLKNLFNNQSYKAWTLGNGVLTAQAGKFNYVMLRYRRPTGTIAWTMKLVNSIHHNLKEEASDSEEVDEFFKNCPYLVSTMKNPTVVTPTATTTDAPKPDYKLSLSPDVYEHENFLNLVQTPFAQETTEQSYLSPEMGGRGQDMAAPTSTPSVPFVNFLNQSLTTPTLESYTSRSSSQEDLTDPYDSDWPNPSSSPINKAILGTSPSVATEPKPSTVEISRKASLTQPFDIFEPLPSYDEDIGKSPPLYIANSLLGVSMDKFREKNLRVTPQKSETAEQLQEVQSPALTSPDHSSVAVLATPRSNHTSPINTQHKEPETTSPQITRRSRSSSDSSIHKVKSSIDELLLPDVESLKQTRDITPLTPPVNPVRTPSLDLSKIPEAIDVMVSSSATTTTNIPLSSTYAASSLKINPSITPKKVQSVSANVTPTIGTLTERKKPSLKAALSTIVRKLPKSSSEKQIKKTSTSAPTPPSVTLSPIQQSQQPKHKTAMHPNFPYLFLRNWPFLSTEEPHGLNINEMLTRALNMLDRIPSFETTKIGMLYVAEGQTKEEQILQNTHGSPHYFNFLRELGEFVSLQEQKNAFTGGLDNSEQLTDGEYSLVYKDEVSQIVFHVATLMPNIPGDTKFYNKKKHIGNDYITIVYSDSDTPCNVNMISGQFNFVYIIIYCLGDGLSRVEVKVKDGITLPRFGPLSHSHIVSDDALSKLVRLTAIHADFAVKTYRKLEKQENVSNWEERLRQIHVIKQRYIKPPAQNVEATNEQDANQIRFMNALNDFFDT